ncbi:MAG: AraC family transcriptional regulator [Proteobacteria bacterium]|nr:AraC family transcriptional regulator [Pseudomonadota bacterium]
MTERALSNGQAPDDGGRHRVGVVAELPRLLAERGVPAEQVLGAAGLPADLLRNPENAVSFPDLCRLLSLAAEATDCPHICALMGRRGGTSSLGLVGRLMRSAPTLGDAMLDLACNQHRYIRGAVAYLLVQGDSALWGYTLEQSQMDGAGLACEAAMGIGVSMIEELTGSRPDEVLLARGVPADRGPYESAYGVPVRLRADLYAVVIKRDQLRQPLRTHDRALRAILQKQVAAYWAHDPPGVAAKVRRSLAARITTQSATATAVAADLNMSLRTMTRRLEDERITFRDLVAEARFNASRHLIRATGLPLTDISLALGYTSQSAFTRAFSRWAGCSPTAWRGSAPLAADRIDG